MLDIGRKMTDIRQKANAALFLRLVACD